MGPLNDLVVRVKGFSRGDERSMQFAALRFYELWLSDVVL